MTDPGHHVCSVYKGDDSASYQHEMGRGHRARSPSNHGATSDDGAFARDPSATSASTAPPAAAAASAGYTHQREAIIRPQQARKFGLVPGGGGGGGNGGGGGGGGGAGPRLSSGCPEMKGWGVSRSPARSPSGKHRGREKFKRFGKGSQPSSYGSKGSLTIGIAYPQQKSASQPQRIRDAGEGATQSHEDNGKGLLPSSPAFTKQAQHFQQENDTCYGVAADAVLQQPQLQLPMAQLQQAHHPYRPSAAQNFGVQACGQTPLNHAADKHFAMKLRTNKSEVLHTHGQGKYLNSVQNACASSLQQVLASDSAFLLADGAICGYKPNAAIRTQKGFGGATLMQPNNNYQPHALTHGHRLHSQQQQQAPVSACDSEISLATSPVTCPSGAALESGSAEHNLWHVQRSQTPGVHMAKVYVGPPLWKSGTGGSSSQPLLPQRQSMNDLKSPQMTMVNGSQAIKTTTSRVNVNGASQEFTSYQEMSLLAMDSHSNDAAEIVHHQHMSKFDALPPYTRANALHANGVTGLPVRSDLVSELCKQQVFVPPSSSSRKDNKQWAHSTSYGLPKLQSNHKIADVFKHCSAAVDPASVANHQLPWTLFDDAHHPLPSPKSGVPYSLAELPAYPGSLDLSASAPAVPWFSSPNPSADDGCLPPPVEFNAKQPQSGYEWRVPTFECNGVSSNFPDSCATGADIARMLDLQPYGGGQAPEASDASEWPASEHPPLQVQGVSVEDTEDSAQQKLLSSLSSANLDQLNVLLKCKQCDKQFSTVGACLHHRQFCFTSTSMAAVAAAAAASTHRTSQARGEETEQGMMGAPHSRSNEGSQTPHRTNKFGPIANRSSSHEGDKDARAGRLNGMATDGGSFCSLVPSDIEIEDAKLDSLILETLNCLSYQLDGSDIDNSFVEAFVDEIMPGKQQAEKQLVADSLSQMSLPPVVECDSADTQAPNSPKIRASTAKGKDMNKLKIETLKQKRKPKKSGTKHQQQTIDHPSRTAEQGDVNGDVGTRMEPSNKVSCKWYSQNKHKVYRVSSLHGAWHDGQNSQKDRDADCTNDPTARRCATPSVAALKNDKVQPTPVRHSKKHLSRNTHGNKSKRSPPVGVPMNGLLHKPEPVPRAPAAFKLSEAIPKDVATSQHGTKKTRESEYDFVSDSDEELFAEKNALHRIKTKGTLGLKDGQTSVKAVNRVTRTYGVSKSGRESKSNVRHNVADSESVLRSLQKAHKTSAERVGKCATDSDASNESVKDSRQCYDRDEPGSRRQKSLLSSVEVDSMSALTAAKDDEHLRHLRRRFGIEADVRGLLPQRKAFMLGQGGVMQINDAERDESEAECYGASNAHTGEKTDMPASSQEHGAKDVNCERTKDGSQVNSCPDTSVWLNKSVNDNPSVWAVAKHAAHDKTEPNVKEGLEALSNDAPFIQIEKFFTDVVEQDNQLQASDPVHLEHLDRITSEVGASKSPPYMSQMQVFSQHTRGNGGATGDQNKELSHQQPTMNLHELHTKENSGVPHDDRWDLDTENILSDLQLPEFDCTLFPEIANEKSLLLPEDHVADRDLDDQREFENFVSFVTDKTCMSLSEKIDQATLTDDQHNENGPISFAKLCADGRTTCQSPDTSTSASTNDSDSPPMRSERSDTPRCDFDVTVTTEAMPAPLCVTQTSERFQDSATQADVSNAAGMLSVAETLGEPPLNADVAGADGDKTTEIEGTVRDGCTGALMNTFENLADANDSRPSRNEYFLGGNDAACFSIFGEISSLSVMGCEGGDAELDSAKGLHEDENRTVPSPNQHFPKDFLNELPVIIVVDNAPENNPREDNFPPSAALDRDASEGELEFVNAGDSSVVRVTKSQGVSGDTDHCVSAYVEGRSLGCETQHQQQRRMFSAEVDETSAGISRKGDGASSPAPAVRDVRSEIPSQSEVTLEHDKQARARQQIMETRPARQLEKRVTSEGGWHSKSLHSADHLTSERPGLNLAEERQENESALSGLLEAADEAGASTSGSHPVGVNVRGACSEAVTSLRKSDLPAAKPRGEDRVPWQSSDTSASRAAAAVAAADCLSRDHVTRADGQQRVADGVDGTTEESALRGSAAMPEEEENRDGSSGGTCRDGTSTSRRETDNPPEPPDARGRGSPDGESCGERASRRSTAGAEVSLGAERGRGERGACQTSAEKPQESLANVADNDFLKCLLPAAACGAVSDCGDCEMISEMRRGECNRKGGVDARENVCDGRDDEGDDFAGMILPKLTLCASESEGEKSTVDAYEIQSGESGACGKVFEIYDKPHASASYSPTSEAADVSTERQRQHAGCGVQDVFETSDGSKENPSLDRENCFQVSTSIADGKDDFKAVDGNDKETIIEAVSKTYLIISQDFYQVSAQPSPESAETVTIIRDDFVNGEAATADYSNARKTFENDSSNIDASILRETNTGKRVYARKKLKLHTIESGSKSQNEFLHYCGINPGIRISQSHNLIESHISENNPKLDGFDKSKLDGVKSNSGCILSIVAKSTDVCFITEDKGAAERSSCTDCNQNIQQRLLFTEDEHCLESQNEAHELKDHTGDASPVLPARDDRPVNSAAAAAAVTARDGNESTCVLPMPRIEAATGATLQENIQQFDECKISRRKPRGLSDDESNTLQWQSNKTESAGDTAGIKDGGGETTVKEQAAELGEACGSGDRIQTVTEEAKRHPEHGSPTLANDPAMEERDSPGGGGGPSSVADANQQHHSSSALVPLVDAAAIDAEQRAGGVTTAAASPAGSTALENKTTAGERPLLVARSGKIPLAVPAISCEFCRATFATAISRSRHTVIKHHIKGVPRPALGDNVAAGIDSGVRMESLALENPTVLINHSENPSVLIKQTTERKDEGAREDEMKGVITSAISMLLCRHPGSATVKQQSISEVDSDSEENSLSGYALIGRSVSVREAERCDTNLSHFNHFSDFAQKPGNKISRKDTKFRSVRHFDGFSKQNRGEKVSKLTKRHAFKRRISKCVPKREENKTLTCESERGQSAAKKPRALSDMPSSKKSRECRNTASAIKSTASVCRCPSLTNGEKCDQIESGNLHSVTEARDSEMRSIGDITSAGTGRPLPISALGEETSLLKLDAHRSEHTIASADFEEVRGIEGEALADCADAPAVLSASGKAENSPEHPRDSQIGAGSSTSSREETATGIENAHVSGVTRGGGGGGGVSPGSIATERRSSAVVPAAGSDALCGAGVRTREEIVNGGPAGGAAPVRERREAATGPESNRGPAPASGGDDEPPRGASAAAEDAEAGATADTGALQAGHRSPSGVAASAESGIGDAGESDDGAAVLQRETIPWPGDGAESRGTTPPRWCKACSLSFPGDDELSKHVASHGPALPAPTCYMCVQRKFSSLEQLKEHLWSKHTKNKPASWTCGMCLRAFTDVWLYNEHLREHAAHFSKNTGPAHKRSPAAAARPDRPRENARVSTKRHKPARQKPRPTDAENFKPSAKAEEERRRAKRKRISAASAAAERESDQSGRKRSEFFASDLSTFDFPVDDEQSARTHPECNDPSRDCHHCGKQFPKPFKLQRHLVVHSVQKMYLCHCCPNAFHDPSQLKSHLAAAHDLTEEPDAKHVTIYDCEQCANVMNIIKKSFVCSACNYVFCKKEQYDRHVDKHLKGDSNSVKYQGAKRPPLLSGEERPRKRSAAAHAANAAGKGDGKEKRKHKESGEREASVKKHKGAGQPSDGERPERCPPAARSGGGDGDAAVVRSDKSQGKAPSADEPIRAKTTCSKGSADVSLAAGEGPKDVGVCQEPPSIHNQEDSRKSTAKSVEHPAEVLEKVESSQQATKGKRADILHAVDKGSKYASSSSAADKGSHEVSHPGKVAAPESLLSATQTSKGVARHGLSNGFRMKRQGSSSHKPEMSVIQARPAKSKPVKKLPPLPPIRHSLSKNWVPVKSKSQAPCVAKQQRQTAEAQDSILSQLFGRKLTNFKIPFKKEPVE